MLKVNGRCGVVIKNTFLNNTDNAGVALRKQLIEERNLFAAQNRHIVQSLVLMLVSSMRYCAPTKP